MVSPFVQEDRFDHNNHVYFQWQPKPTIPTVEVFVKECRIVPAEFDIMGIRGVYHKERVLELVDRFKVWREDRVPGVRAFQSTYDRCSLNITHMIGLPSHHPTESASLFASGSTNRCTRSMPFRHSTTSCR